MHYFFRLSMNCKIFLLAISVAIPCLLFGQTFKLKGTVADSVGVPMKGVFIANTGGKQKHKISNYKGLFSLKVAVNDTLILITPQEKIFKTVVKSENSVKFILIESGNHIQPDGQALIFIEESEKERFAEILLKFKKTTITNYYNTIYDLLKAEAPGLEVNEGSNLVFIRGINSLSGNQSALIIVDGVKNFDIRNLDPNDVESVKIVKDGTVGFYGGAASGGVIKIETKKGRK